MERVARGHLERGVHHLGLERAAPGELLARHPYEVVHAHAVQSVDGLEGSGLTVPPGPEEAVPPDPHQRSRQPLSHARDVIAGDDERGVQRPIGEELMEDVDPLMSQILRNIHGKSFDVITNVICDDFITMMDMKNLWGF